MPILQFSDDEALGAVVSVDTAKVDIEVSSLDKLRRMQVNRLVALSSSKVGQHLIGLVERITRRSEAGSDDVDRDDFVDAHDDSRVPERNLVRVVLVGTMLDRVGEDENIFRRSLESVPDIDARCFPIEADRLTGFMQSVAAGGVDPAERLRLGHYVLDEHAHAFLDGNKFFQRHALLVGSTGSGKSWTVAKLAEQIAARPTGNALLFDIHGEYRPLQSERIPRYRVAGPSDIASGAGLAQGVLHLPHWLLGYEEMASMLFDRSDQNAPNQVMLFSRTVRTKKKEALEKGKHSEVLKNFTIDSPVPYVLEDVLTELKRLDAEMVPGARGVDKQGDFYGKLSRFIARLESKATDRRLGFMFQVPAAAMEYEWLSELVSALLAGPTTDGGAVKIIDLSEVPSDVLPLVVGVLARVVFTVQQWVPAAERHPIALLCDEAHLYIAASSDGAGEASARTFARIAKEGRKYGVGLVVITQRPSEVSRTVLSQCNNVVAMRLTNAEDQDVVRRLLPDNLGRYGELLPVLDRGEAVVVGDASLLPARIRIEPPNVKPDSATIDFWTRWGQPDTNKVLAQAVESLRRQTHTT